MTTFLNDWHKFYGDAPPLSFALAKDERWARLHALPGSKRYAETPDEEAEILRRANIVASETLGLDQCWIVQLGSIELGWDKDAERWRTEFKLTPAGEVIYDEFVWPIFAAKTSFRIREFDGLLRDIAADQAFRTLWFNDSNGRVFAPYDGGFDTFFENGDCADALRSKHRGWLSPRADGL